MRAELAGVFAGNVVLVGIVLENDQIRQATDKGDLADFLLEAQEKDDPLVAVDFHCAAKIVAQVGLIISVEPAHLTLAVCRDTVVQAVKNDPLLLLYQQEDFHAAPVIEPIAQQPAL
ncbi:hypothetical protein D3C75_1120020 [compost metagenome]